MIETYFKFLDHFYKFDIFNIFISTYPTSSPPLLGGAASREHLDRSRGEAFT
jgi:hypothetical protein